MLTACSFSPELSTSMNVETNVESSAENIIYSYVGEYPVYEIMIKGAFLRSDMDVRGDNIISGIAQGTSVAVLEVYNIWSLVYTQDEVIGYIQNECLSDTGRKRNLDIVLPSNVPLISENTCNSINVALDVVIPNVDELGIMYPATITRLVDGNYQQSIIEILLGEKYLQTAETDYSINYESTDPSIPYRYVVLNKQNGSIWFYDAMVTGERDGEYKAPQMNMLPEESLPIAQNRVAELLGFECVAIPSKRWMKQLHIEYGDSDMKYERCYRENDSHTFYFERLFDNGLTIMDGGVKVTIGMNGISELEIDCSKYENILHDSIVPLSLDEAIRITSKICQRSTTLVYAELVYSNYVTHDEKYNLSWYLLTRNGAYVVDCVHKKAVCSWDMY